jgi:very-short-patch-repair endonuclease
MPSTTPALPDVFRGSTAVAAGLLTRSQLRNRRVVQPVLYDVYRRADVEPDHALRCRAAGLAVPAGTVLTGRSLAHVWGVDLARPDDDVTMAVLGRAAPEMSGVSVRVVRRGPLAHGRWRGIATAGPYRMAFDLAARLPLEDAVAVLDAVARERLIDVAGFQRWLLGRHDDDVVAVREAAALADARAESRPESVCRVRLLRAGHEVVPQHVVRDENGFVARVDLALLVLRIAIEYDGAWHGDGAQVVRDRQRLNRLREAGWIVVHVTAAMLRGTGALEAAVARAVSQRLAGAR